MKAGDRIKALRPLTPLKNRNNQVLYLYYLEQKVTNWYNIYKTHHR